MRRNGEEKTGVVKSKTFSCDNMSATNPTWNSPKSNTGLRGNYRLSYGTSAFARKTDDVKTREQFCQMRFFENWLLGLKLKLFGQSEICM
jgi:hypothetical protein